MRIQVFNLTIGFILIKYNISRVFFFLNFLVPISVTKNNNMTSIVEEGELSVKIEDGDKSVKTGTETSHKSGFQINKDLLNPKKLKVKLTKKHSISEVDTNLDHHNSATFAGTTSGSDPTLQPLLKTKSSIGT